jgi:hypothetical protein
MFLGGILGAGATLSGALTAAGATAATAIGMSNYYNATPPDAGPGDAAYTPAPSVAPGVSRADAYASPGVLGPGISPVVRAFDPAAYAPGPMEPASFSGSAASRKSGNNPSPSTGGEGGGVQNVYVVNDVAEAFRRGFKANRDLLINAAAGNIHQGGKLARAIRRPVGG